MRAGSPASADARHLDLFGIVIRMYHDDHPPPHFHASYQGFTVFMRIADGEVMHGELPKKAARIVLQWALDHQDALMANWARGEALEPMELVPEPMSMIELIRIEPTGDQALDLIFSDGSRGRWEADRILARIRC